MRTKSVQEGGFTWVELLVVLGIVAVLVLMPATHCFEPGSLSRGQAAQMLSNMKQLHLATQVMEMDAVTTGETNAGWPGGTFNVWASNLVAGNYLSTNDLCKLLSGAGRVTPLGRMPTGNNNAVLVYAAGVTGATNVIFLTSANFTNTPTGGIFDAGSPLFGGKCHVYLGSDGHGEIVRKDVTNQPTRHEDITMVRSMTNPPGYAPLLP